jgi:DNA-binding beta-propeller fold protein YncE
MPPLRLTSLLQTALSGLSTDGRAVVSALGCFNGDTRSSGQVAALVGLRSRYQVARTLRREGLPPLEALAAWARILYWLQEAETTSPTNRAGWTSSVAEAGAQRPLCGGGLLRIAGVMIAALLAACSSSTAPAPGPPKLVGRVLVPGGPIDIAVAPSGIAYVTRFTANAVDRINLGTLTVTDSITVGAGPTFVIFDHTGATGYVSNQQNQNVGVINVGSASQTRTIATTGDPIPMQVTADGVTLFVTTNANRLYKIVIATGAATDSLDLPATSHHLLLHPDGALLYVATRDGGSVLEVNTATLTVARTFTLGGRTQAMVLSSDRRRLYVANETKPLIQIVSLTTGAVADSVALHGGANGVALSPDGRLLCASIIDLGEVQVFDRATLALDTTFVTGGVPRAVVPDPINGQVVVANESGWVDVIH